MSYDPEANPPFQDRFVKRFSQKKWDDLEKSITGLVRDALNPDYKTNDSANTVIVCTDDEESFVSIGGNNVDWTQALGILQGVCYYGLSMRSLGADNIKGTPKNWLSEMCRNMGKIEYKRRKEKGIVANTHVAKCP